MKIDFITFANSPHYVIRDGKAIRVQNPESLVKNASYGTKLNDYVTSQVENVVPDEQKKMGSATREELKRALENAQIAGLQGEELVNDYLERKKKDGLIDDFDWTSNTNVIAPYDFIIKQNGLSIYIDVKSTKGEFSSLIHISYNELLQMEKDACNYQMYRVYEMREHEALLRIADNLSRFAKEIINVFRMLPERIRPDGINLPANVLEFEEEIINL